MTTRDYSNLIDKILAASTEARATIKELHEATRDARQASKELRGVIEQAKKAGHDAVTEDVEALVNGQLDVLAEETQKQMRISVAGVEAEFNRLTKLLMYGNATGSGDSLEDMINLLQAARRVQGLP